MIKYEFINALERLEFVDSIVLFGSRARGDNAPRADIDIAISCPKASMEQWLEVIDIVDEADTLLKIDCVRLEDLPEDSELKQNIRKEGITIYGKH